MDNGSISNEHLQLAPDVFSADEPLPLQHSAVFHFVKRWLPRRLKHMLLAIYWPLKARVEDLREYTAELVGHIPSHALRLWWYEHICRIQIGQHSSVHRECRMYCPHRIQIGNHCVVNRGVLLDARLGLQIGDNVSISEGAVILTMAHDVDDPGFGLQGGSVSVEDYVFIGAFALILPGVTLGRGAVIAAGAVVTHDVPPFSVVGGTPAHFIRERSHNQSYQLFYRKWLG